MVWGGVKGELNQTWKRANSSEFYMSASQPVNHTDRKQFECYNSAK